jgi:hypothetical protein
MRDAPDDELAKVPGVTAPVIAGLRALFSEIDGEVAEVESEVAGAEGDATDSDSESIDVEDFSQSATAESPPQ